MKCKQKKFRNVFLFKTLQHNTLLQSLLRKITTTFFIYCVSTWTGPRSSRVECGRASRQQFMLTNFPSNVTEFHNFVKIDIWLLREEPRFTAAEVKKKKKKLRGLMTSFKRCHSVGWKPVIFHRTTRTIAVFTLPWIQSASSQLNTVVFSELSLRFTYHAEWWHMWKGW